MSSPCVCVPKKNVSRVAPATAGSCGGRSADGGIVCPRQIGPSVASGDAVGAAALGMDAVGETQAAASSAASSSSALPFTPFLQRRGLGSSHVPKGACPSAAVASPDVLFVEGLQLRVTRPEIALRRRDLTVPGETLRRR